jgi:hypothetical protein
MWIWSTGTTRRIPIEPELRPLLERLHGQRKGKNGERVLWLPDNEDRAVLLREHLRVAGVERAELFANDAGRKNMTFHDLRATGITWAAVRGDDPLRIKQRAGHKAFSTTEICIREAENLRDGFGLDFPPLPPDLLATRPGGFRLSALSDSRRSQKQGVPSGATGDRILKGTQRQLGDVAVLFVQVFGSPALPVDGRFLPFPRQIAGNRPRRGTGVARRTAAASGEEWGALAAQRRLQPRPCGVILSRESP